MAVKLWTFPPTARLAEREIESLTRDVARARFAFGDAGPVARVGTTDIALMNFVQKDTERTLDPDALQHEATLNIIDTTQNRLEQDTQLH